MNQELTDFLEKKHTQSDAIGTINWDARRDGYIKAVNELYQQIETILADPIARKTVVLHRRPKTMTENYVGSYSVDDLILLIGAEMIRFSPAGRNVAEAPAALTLSVSAGRRCWSSKPTRDGDS